MYGQDNFSLHQELKRLKAELGGSDMLEVNTTVLDGREKLGLSQLQDVCSAAPFLSQVRLVVVEGLLEHFEPSKKTGKRSAKAQPKMDSGMKEWQGLSNYIEKMPVTTVLILIDGKLDNRKNPLLKHLNPLTKARVFLQPQGKILRDWIKKHISEGGGNVSHDAINLLEKLIGGDLWNMSSEIDKLITFCHGRLITEDDVRQVTSYTRETNIFALVDAILEGNRKVAQHLLHRLLQEGTAPQQVLALIIRQLRWVVMAKDINPKLTGPEGISRLGIPSDYVFGKVLEQAKVYSKESVKAAYHKVLEADLAIKTGQYDDDLALDLLVMELCKKG
jgi:DNA polymerase-3 subunit delta